MEPTVFKYTIRHSLRQQIVVLAVTFLSFPFLYASLDLPKTIVNQAIGASAADFPTRIQGIELTQVEYLALLCTAFLVLVLINGAFKYYINVFKGQLGERMLRRLRFELYSRILRFPLPHFRKVSQGETVAMITAEVEMLGGFFGDAFALPSAEGGRLLTILAFMFVQNPILCLAAVALYPLQIYLIPKMQRQVNALAKRRVITVRRLSEQIGETVTGVQEIHAHDASEWERAEFSQLVSTIYDIRYDIYRKKFFIKFLNNFLAQLAPFFFYSIGGYLVITGQLTFGALVAVLTAHKDLLSPWKELLSYYQSKEDARIKYEQLVDQFQPAGMLEPSLLEEPADPLSRLDADIVATNLSFEEEGGIKELDGVSFHIDTGQRVALYGPGGAGRAVLARLMARLLFPASGTVKIGTLGLSSLPEAVTGRRIAYVDQASYIFTGTVLENLLYGLKHRPLRPTDHSPDDARLREKFVAEAQLSGNTDSDLSADWVDYEAAGVDGPDQLATRINQVLNDVGLADDVFQMALQRTVAPDDHNAALADRILVARSALRERLRDPALRDLIEPFDLERYNGSMTVAENLLFGTPIGVDFDLEHLGRNPYVWEILSKTGLSDAMLTTGREIAAVMVDLFQDLPPDHEYFERFGFFSSDELPDVQQCLRRADSAGLQNISAADRELLLSLPFKLIPARHRLGLIDENMQNRLLEARWLFARNLPDDLKGAVAFFDSERYNAAASIQDNILFGKLTYSRPHARGEVDRLIAEVVDELDLRADLVRVGLDSPVGVAGSRLSLGQRQKLAIGRCLLKRPDLLIINEATAGLDLASQRKIMEAAFREMENHVVIWVVGQAEQAAMFDRIIQLEGGKVVAQGGPEILDIRTDVGGERAASE